MAVMSRQIEKKGTQRRSAIDSIRYRKDAWTREIADGVEGGRDRLTKRIEKDCRELAGIRFLPKRMGMER